MRLFKRSSSEEGQAMIEFVLIFPIVLLLIFGIIEFAFLSLAYQNVNYAAFAAARSRIVGITNTRLTAAMTLFALSPAYIDGAGPEDYLTDLFEENIIQKIEDKFSVCPAITNRISAWGSTRDKIVGLLTSVFEFFLGVGDPLFTADAGTLPGFIKKMAYAYALTSVEESMTEYVATPNPTSMGDFMRLKDPIGTHTVRVTVTYLYALKFPVVDSLFSLYYKYAPSSAPPNEDAIFAVETFRSSKIKFLPIQMSCTMGMEVVP